MIFSILLDFFTNKCYPQSRGEIMNEFMNYEFPNIDVGFCGFVDSGLGRVSNYNRGNHLLLFSVAKEPKTFELSTGKTIVLGYNEIMYLPYRSGYVCKTLPTGLFYMIEFQIPDIINAQPFIFAPKDTSKMLSDFSAIARINKRKGIAYKLQIRSILCGILASMQIEYNQKYINSNSKAIITPAIEHIHSNYTKQQFNIKDLAEICMISEDYFRKLFKATYGISPRKYVNRLKTSYAADLISSGVHSVTDACYLAGFENTSYFSREFKKRFGVSPIEYKKIAVPSNARPVPSTRENQNG